MNANQCKICYIPVQYGRRDIQHFFRPFTQGEVGSDLGISGINGSLRVTDMLEIMERMNLDKTSILLDAGCGLAQ